MSDQAIVTYEALKALGFVDDQSVISNDPGGLGFDFGNFKLDASHCLNSRYVDVVLLSGVMTTPRTIAEVRCEMPRELESQEQGAAWVTWCLDRRSHGSFKPAVDVPWLELGRRSQHLLPWERQSAAYAARPQCQVGRDWVRVALRDLAAAISEVDDSASVDFKFDGEVLTIRCGSKLIAMPASGEPWATRYRMSAGSLRRLPRRLSREPVHWSVWDSALSIGNHRYRGVIALDAGA